MYLDDAIIYAKTLRRTIQVVSKQVFDFNGKSDVLSHSKSEWKRTRSIQDWKVVNWPVLTTSEAVRQILRFVGYCR